MNVTHDTTLAGDGDCTLREAITNANGDGDTTGGDCAPGAGADEIRFAQNLVGQTLGVNGVGDSTWRETALRIDTQITISGPPFDMPGVTINAGGTKRLFYVSGSGNLTLSDLTLSGGRARGEDADGFTINPFGGTGGQGSGGNDGGGGGAGSGGSGGFGAADGANGGGVNGGTSGSGAGLGGAIQPGALA